MDIYAHQNDWGVAAIRYARLTSLNGSPSFITFPQDSFLHLRIRRPSCAPETTFTEFVKNGLEAEVESVRYRPLRLITECLSQFGKRTSRESFLRSIHIDDGVVSHFAESVTKDKIIDESQHGKLFYRRHAGFGKRLKTLLHVERCIFARQGGLHGRKRPGVPDEHIACALGNRGQRLTPVFRQSWDKYLSHERVVHRSDQLRLRLRVVVEAHRSHPKLLCDASH